MATTSALPGIPDDQWEEVAQEIPSPDDDFIKKYLAGQEALKDQEKKQRSDYAFKQSLSPIARKACEIADRIRDEERRSIWTAEFESTLARTKDVAVYPGMAFNLAKDRMESTRLWQIVRKMPKGALLHAHFDALADQDYLFTKMLETPGMHIYATDHLATPEHRKSLKIQIRFKFMKAESTTANIWSSNYKANDYVLATRAADEFPDGGRSGFLEWLKYRCTISLEESLEQHYGVDDVWQKFMNTFRIIDSIILYEPLYRIYWTRVFTLLNEDGVRWADIRATFMMPLYREGEETTTADILDALQIFEEILEDFKSSEAGKGFWGARIIWAAYRGFDQRGIIESMDKCIEAKMAYPHLIAGFDCVGQEDLGRPLKDLLPELFWFRKQCAQEGLDIPFFFHAGECLGDGSDTDNNLFDAILLGTRRIGHGYSLYKHPLLTEMVKEKKILIESCPISNEVLRLCGSAMSHPLPALLARGVACALSNDDPSMLGQGTAGLTHDFWQALQGWQNLGLAGLGSLAENSVRWAAFEDQSAGAWLADIKEASLGDTVRAQHLREWAVEWEQFCLWVVDEFGDGEGLEEKS